MLASFVEYIYDDYTTVPMTNLPVAPTQVEQFSAAYFPPGAVLALGKVTQTKRYDVTNTSSFVQTKTSYYATGLVAAVTDPMNKTSYVSYNDSFIGNVGGTPGKSKLAYPTTLTDPDSFASTVQYEYDTGFVKQTTDPRGGMVTRTYDTVGRIQKITSQGNDADASNDASTEYSYPFDNSYVSTYTTLADATLANRFFSLTLLDGFGRSTAKLQDHPGSAGGYRLQYSLRNSNGQVSSVSNPTEVNASWDNNVTGGDDTGSIYWSTQTFDWKGRPRVHTNQGGVTSQITYGGCGCAGGEETTITDEVGRMQKIYRDSLGRTAKTKIYKLDNSLESTTVNIYNVRDQITAVKVYQGTETSDGSCPLGTCQQTETVYDGHGRAQKQYLPVYQDAGVAPLAPSHTYAANAQARFTSYQYAADDKVTTITDPRGSVITYGYNTTAETPNNRRLLTSVTYTEATCGTPPPGITCVAETPDVSLEYNNLGLRTKMRTIYSTGTKTSTYSYDPLHRLQSEVQQLPGLSGDYALTYAWTPGGQVQSLTDSLTGSSASYTGTTVNYAYDKAGQLSQISGQSGGNTLQFFNSLKYRAWGATKEIVHGNSVRSLMTWDRQMMRLSRFDLDNMQQVTSWIPPNPPTYGPLTMTWEYDYHADGRVNHAWDRNWNLFDRAYTWDHLGRVSEAYTGIEANGQTWQSGQIHTNPYRQSLRYDAFGNMNDRFGFFWSRYQSSGSGYTNDRRGGWTYDASGKITQDDAGTHTLNVTGNQTAFVSWTQISLVHGVATGLPDLPMSEIAQDYDGGGQAVKRVETQRDPDYNQNNQTWYYNENVTTTHYVRSSVLGGVVIAELDQTGAKEKAFVYAGGNKIAEHHVVGGSFVEWRHPNPGTTSWITSDSNRTGTRKEMDPLGAATGTTDPFPVYLDYTDIRNGEPLYLDGGNPFDYSGGCELDGLPISCSDFQRRVESGSVETQTMFGKGDVYHLGGGRIAYDWAYGRKDDGEGGTIPLIQDGAVQLPTPNHRQVPLVLPPLPQITLPVVDPCVSAVIADTPQGMRNAARTAVPLLLNNAESAGLTAAQAAYVLATARHESTFAPIREIWTPGRPNRWQQRYEGNTRLGNNQTGDGFLFRGRGYVQITGRRNYEVYANLLGIDLVGDPDLALEPSTAAHIAVHGMQNGIFTGRSLNDYINENGQDFLNARRIINGDVATNGQTIAGYANTYLDALNSCGWGPLPPPR